MMVISRVIIMVIRTVRIIVVVGVVVLHHSYGGVVRFVSWGPWEQVPIADRFREREVR